MKKNLFFRREKELQNLDTLTDIFSFFNEFDASVTRQTCKWWNDLLLKDEIIKRMIKKDEMPIIPSLDKMDMAIVLGYLSLVKWNKSCNHEISWRACTYTSMYGHLTILKWIRLQGAEWYHNTDYHIVKERNANLKVLKWSIANGCKYNSDISSRAASRGHLDILMWCKNTLKDKIEWNVEICEVSREQPHIQDYIHSLPPEESPCECPRGTNHAIF